MKENLHTKLIESLVNKKFKYWKEEFVKKLKEESKHIKICDKLNVKGKQIILSEDLCSVKDVEEFLGKIDELACLSSKRNLK